MAAKELWLVRHGESIANVAATQAERDGLDEILIDIRDADVPLSETGTMQAEALGAWLAPHRASIEACWVSPYVRARDTLLIALGANGHPRMVIDERLRDRELGILDLLTRKGVARLHPEEAERRRRLGKYYYRPPGGESWADVALRLRSFLGDALPSTDDGALIIAHDAVVMLLVSLLLPLDEEHLLELASTHTVLNASVTHLVRNGSQWTLAEFSGVGHLQTEGAPITAHPGSPDAEPE